MRARARRDRVRGEQSRWGGPRHESARFVGGWARRHALRSTVAHDRGLGSVAEAKIGKWSQGVAWSRDGKTLLAQNMAEHSISVLSFDGTALTVTGEIKVNGGPNGLRTAER